MPMIGRNSITSDSATGTRRSLRATAFKSCRMLSTRPSRRSSAGPIRRRFRLSYTQSEIEALSRPALRGLPYQVIVDARNARGRFGRHPNCLSLGVRTGDPPKVHDPPVDCDVEQQSMSPGLVVQMREDAVPNGRVG